ncbi:major capsid protein [Stenotrophomonas maltophilia]|uniref:major capsid protein n=1 Tax=Stenotrophomonas maltophilia TaxID=40324 RepID=UPI0015DECA2E|nr:major capsid protein [Stenotrophomonas maltophilia]MBA0223195.1 major capsid protein [Stenotrophomonas maltophilia]MCU1021480.1 major capsid protein [Stenotrophomonas maltophilia]HEL3863057.1 major capsid protein [Stenotrophomonas maltophilia]HEL4287417.1 major capsid protein [Stenotrophomonas maltophilia]
MDLQTLLALGVLGFDALNAHINNLPRINTRISEMGLFQEDGLIGTTIVRIGIKDNKLVLVPNVPRGAPAQPKGLDRGKVKLLETTHLPQRSTVMADQLLGVWDPINDPEGTNVAAVVNALQAVHKRDLDYTIEYHRMGALRGKVLDADGSTIVDFYEEFDVQQSVIGMELNKADSKVRSKVVAIKRAIEAKLGGVPYSGVHVFCSAGFFDALIDHPDVQEAYKRWQDGAALRNDLRKGFVFGDVTFEELQGSTGGDIAIPDGEAIAFPLGVPDMFLTRFAPADYLETVRTRGLPYYTKTAKLRMDKGIELESQSNPLSINTRPDAVIRLKAGAK